MLRYADTKEPIITADGLGLNKQEIARSVAIGEKRVVELLDKCQHCGGFGAETTYQDSILGCEYEVHSACKDAFRVDIEREVGRYFYGE